MFTHEERQALLAKIRQRETFEAKLANLFETNPKLFYMCYGKIKFMCDRLYGEEQTCTNIDTYHAIKDTRKRLRELSYSFERAVK
jgi:hypothetical protein